jgi:hypothetical protein
MLDKNIYWSLALKGRILKKLNQEEGKKEKKDRELVILLSWLEYAFEQFEDSLPESLIYENEDIDTVE